ncbi:hypothetical protein [Streptomyces avicenniae]|uniref:hypothetical protein n=1 Tax=Streptomyces avicenniae TaxID=500153 RepID=UPI000ACA91F3|nr:hypothetical protein [Streptomyces avicenniae]
MEFDFRAELVGLAEEIRRDLGRELFAFEVGDPVPEESVRAAEIRLGTPLPPSLRRF